MKESGQLFEIGQAVTLIANVHWVDAETNVVDDIGSPKFGKVYHVSGYKQHCNDLYISLKEIPQDWWIQDAFAPVMTDREFCTLYGTISEPETALETA